MMIFHSYVSFPEGISMDINGYQWILRFPTNTERQGWATTTSTAALCAGTVAYEALLLTEAAGECLNV
jgi:hypothetical protein